MFPFIRSDLLQFQAYQSHPSGLSSHLDGLDRLDTNENPLDLPVPLKQTLARAYVEDMQANRYPDGNHGSLKEAIASYVNSSAPNHSTLNASTIDSTHISIGNGSDELIRSILIATCLGQEGAILVANPTFSMYAITATTLGIPVVSVHRFEHDFAIDIAAAEAQLSCHQSPSIRVIFVVHPNSPTANALSIAELQWLRQIPEEILVVIDEAYFEFSQTSLINELDQHHNWIILRTLSKAFRLASHRVGYAIAHPELIKTLEKIRLPYNLSTLSLAAAQLVITHHQELLGNIPEIIAERKRLWDLLHCHPRITVWPSHANFLFLKLQGVNAYLNDQQLSILCQTLRDRGTLVRQINHGIRITIGTAAENQRTYSRLVLVHQ